MKIAIPYEDGMVFQHFGHTEQFKLYEAENGRIVGSELCGTEGSGHGALAGFLAERKAEVLICGGIGPGAKQALDSAGIRLYAGVSGQADEAARAFLAGTLEYSSEANCDHHENGEHCGRHGDGGHCGGSC